MAVDLSRVSGKGRAANDAVIREEIAGLDALERPEVRGQRTWKKIWAEVWPKLGAVAIAIAIWQLVYVSGWKPHYLLPSPWTVFDALGHLLTLGPFWGSLGVTMKRAMEGFVLSSAMGLVVGISAARSRIIRSAVASLLTGLQSMPSVIWVPFALIILGESESAILLVVCLGTAPCVAIGVLGAVDNVPPILVKVGQALGAKRLALFRHVIIPASLPNLITGFQQGWAFTWRSLMSAELLAAIPGHIGIGVRLENSSSIDNYAGVMAYMIVILLVGLVVDFLFERAGATIRRRHGLVAGR